MLGTQAVKTTGQKAQSHYDWLIESLQREPAIGREIMSLWPERHRFFSYERIDSESLPHVIEVINRVWSEKAIGMMCCGDVGTGKTAILRLVQLAAYILYGGYGAAKDHIVYVSHFELVRQLREYQSLRETVGVDQVGTPKSHYVRHLFIDDLGRGYEDKAGWNLSLLEEMFNERYERMKPTFVSTNKTPDELKSWEGWSRIVDRLLDPSYMLTISTGSGSRRKATP